MNKLFVSFMLLLIKQLNIMKKLLLLTACLLFCVSIEAQGISIGAKAGLNLASITGDDATGTDGRTSLHVGAVANFEISEIFAIQPELLYSAQGFKVDDVVFKFDYVSLPILADVSISDGLSLQGGPVVGFNITSEAEGEGQTLDLDAESLDVAAAIGAQFTLPLGIFFQARYNIGFTDIVQDSEAKNSLVTASIGYFFN